MDITVLDKKFVEFAILDVYISSIWTDRFNECGDFELYLPASAEIFDIIKRDYYLRCEKSDRMMIIEDIKVETDSEDGDKVVVTGRSLESILDRRVVWSQTTLSGNLQNGIKQLLTENVINPSKEERKIQNFIFQESTDKAITDLTFEAQYTGDVLYDVIKSICSESQIGFKITMNDSNQFVFSLYAGKDHTYDQTTLPYVIFSPGYENLTSANYHESSTDMKNVTLIGGEGEGADRKYAAVGNVSGLDRRELFTDARDISSNTGGDEPISNEEYTNLLIQRGNEKLAECKEVVEFEGEADTSVMFKYGVDFFMGDLVQIEDAYGHNGIARIMEIVNSTDDSGTSTYPVFQTPEKGDG